VAKFISVILARQGSKGIPDKNIILLNNKPLIAFAIEASLLSKCDETWVSTDGKSIKEVSLKYGARVLERPKEFATDESSSESALIHFANNIECDFIVFIQPTSPLLLSTDINCGIKMMSDYDSVFSGYKEEWSSRWSSKMNTINWNGEDRPRRQDAKDVYVENGAFYITSKKSLLESKSRYSGKIGCVEMSLYRSFQLDTDDDLEFLRKIMSSFKSR